MNRTVRNDELTSPEIPVIARQWKVDTWTTHVVTAVAGEDDTNEAQGGMIFHFSRYDAAGGRFLYSVIGAVTETVKVIERGLHDHRRRVGPAQPMEPARVEPQHQLRPHQLRGRHRRIERAALHDHRRLPGGRARVSGPLGQPDDRQGHHVAPVDGGHRDDRCRTAARFGSIIQVTNAWQFHADIP